MVQEENHRLGRHDIERIHSETFAKWFTLNVECLQMPEQYEVVKDLRFLSIGPNNIGLTYERFIANGFRFNVKDVEQKKKTQNSGVTVKASTNSFSSRRDQNPVLGEVDYYGILKSIIGLDYRGGRRVVLFECDWVSSGSRLKKDENGFLLANFTNVRPHFEPFILASQASQVFYVDDTTENDWKVVINTNARSIYDMQSTLDVETYLQSGNANLESDVEHVVISGLREGIEGVDVNVQVTE